MKYYRGSLTHGSTVNNAINGTRRVISGEFVQFGVDGTRKPTIEISHNRASTDYQQFIEIRGE